jgi:NAD(P)-dependent dehydrogenase (short-subunit alcohol dehydrogenase family)
LEAIGQNVRINAICPGATMTDALASWTETPGVEAAIRQAHPIGRFATPEEIGRLVLAMASDDSSFMVGAAIAADGGLTAH